MHISRIISRGRGRSFLKFFLHVSRKEQRNRFIARLNQPDKRWKFSAADMREREFWDDYMHAFEEAVRATASKHAPWFVVPADNKWFTRLVDQCGRANGDCGRAPLVLGYWAGVRGKNAMRYMGGWFGGTWADRMMSDVGNGHIERHPTAVEAVELGGIRTTVGVPMLR